MLFAEPVIHSHIHSVLVTYDRRVGKVVVYIAGPLPRLIGQRIALENIQANRVESRWRNDIAGKSRADIPRGSRRSRWIRHGAAGIVDHDRIAVGVPHL